MHLLRYCGQQNDRTQYLFLYLEIFHAEEAMAQKTETERYDFDTIIDRHHTDCLKYDFGMERKGRTDLLPLWVADMDFRLPEEVLLELKARIDHGIFGYTDPKEGYFEALNHWFRKHYHYTVEPGWVTVGPGVVYGLATCVRAFTRPGDAILIQQPVYYPFGEVIQDNGRQLVNSQLKLQAGHYQIDFDDFERKIEEYKVKLYLLCNPHNPAGRVWTREELTRIGDICLKHDVLIVSDEIHCDFIYPGHEFHSFLTMDPKYRSHLCVLHSPSKTFNIAGLQVANAIIPDETLRARYKKENAAAGYSQANVLGLTALESVYTRGEEWYQELLSYINGNLSFVRAYLTEYLPELKLIEPEGTYLLWIDFSGLGLSETGLQELITDKAKLWLDSGSIFGPQTAQFERFNIACPRSIVKQAFEQLREAVSELKRNRC